MSKRPSNRIRTGHIYKNDLSDREPDSHIKTPETNGNVVIKV